MQILFDPNAHPRNMPLRFGGTATTTSLSRCSRASPINTDYRRFYLDGLSCQRI